MEWGLHGHGVALPEDISLLTELVQAVGMPYSGDGQSQSPETTKPMKAP